MHMRDVAPFLLILLLGWFLQANAVQAQSVTALTYQGYLEDAGSPATGLVDLELRLFDAESGGLQVGDTITKDDVAVPDGVFTVEVDFGAVFGGEARYLEVGVREGSSTGSYTTLSPRETLRPAPLATALPYLRVERATNSDGFTAINVIGGDPSNAVVDGVTGATIGGGGFDEGPYTSPNRVEASFGTVGGGFDNEASGSNATVGGGGSNAAGGSNATVGGGASNTASGSSATVGGGASNTAGFSDATVGGGEDNTAANNGATVGGGNSNTASGIDASVSGGRSNDASGDYSTVPGGFNNTASGDYSFATGQLAKAEHNGAFVWADNSNSGFLASTAANQFLVRAAGGVGIGTNSPSSPLTVAGAIESTTGGIVFPDGTVQTSAASGGGNAWNLGGNAGTDPSAGDFLGTTDDAPFELRVNGTRALRVERVEGVIDAFGPPYDVTSTNVILGDPSNTVASDVTGATISGGGVDDEARSELNTVTASFGTIDGGLGNTASGFAATVGGGEENTASGEGATVPGGRFNDASGSSSFAAGSGANALHRATFVWSDGGPFSSTGVGQFLIDASGGVGVGTNSPVTQLDVVRNVSGNADASNHVARFENTASSNGDILVLKTGDTSPGSDVNYITFKDGVTSGSNNVGSIQGNGTGGIEFNSGGGDFAEMLPRRNAGEMIAPGEIVGVAGGHITKTTAGAERLMVVSDQALVVGNVPPTGKDGYEKVAFVGQVAVRVEGRVDVGDFIVASRESDGVGRAVAPEAWDPVRDGLIVGQAWEAQAGGTGRVTTAVGLDVTKPLIDRLAEQQSHLAQQSARIDALEQELQSLRTLVRTALSTGDAR